MKIIQNSSNFNIEMSEQEWQQIGEKNQWQKTAQVAPPYSPINEDSMYSQEVNVFISAPNSRDQNGEVLDLETTKTIVKFSIELDAKSWGIKNIIVRINSISPIDLIDTEGNTHGTINIESAKIKQEHINSKVITVGGIDLVLFPDNTVDYNKSAINIENFMQSVM